MAGFPHCALPGARQPVTQRPAVGFLPGFLLGGRLQEQMVVGVCVHFFSGKKQKSENKCPLPLVFNPVFLFCSPKLREMNCF